MLAPEAPWVICVTQTQLVRRDAATIVMRCSEKPIPNEQDLAEINLGVLVVTLVVPSVHFRDAEQAAEWSERVVDIGVLESEMHRQDRKPCRKRCLRRAE